MCEVDGNAGVGVVSAGHVGGTRGSGNVSSAADVLWMSVVRGMRGVGGVYEMCMCLALGGEWMRGVQEDTACTGLNCCRHPHKLCLHNSCPQK